MTSSGRHYMCSITEITTTAVDAYAKMRRDTPQTRSRHRPRGSWPKEMASNTRLLWMKYTNMGNLQPQW